MSMPGRNEKNIFYLDYPFKVTPGRNLKDTSWIRLMKCHFYVSVNKGEKVVLCIYFWLYNPLTHYENVWYAADLFFFSFNNAPPIKKIELAYDIYLSHRLIGNVLLSAGVFFLFSRPLFSQWCIALSDYLTFNGVIATSKGIAMNDKNVWHFLMNSD